VYFISDWILDQLFYFHLTKIIGLIEGIPIFQTYFITFFIINSTAIFAGLIGHWWIDSTTIRGVHWFNLKEYTMKGYARVDSRNSIKVRHFYYLIVVIIILLELIIAQIQIILSIYFFGVLLIVIFSAVLLRNPKFVKKYLWVKTCPTCYSLLVIRMDKTGEEFWGCYSYSDLDPASCRYTEPLTRAEQDYKSIFLEDSPPINWKWVLLECITLVGLFFAGIYIHLIFSLLAVSLYVFTFLYSKTTVLDRLKKKD
jgi:hypothetical protein